MDSCICNACGRHNRQGLRFCTECGTRLQEKPKSGPRLVMLYGEGNEVVFPIHQNRTTIGRDITNHIILRDEKISKQHAAIVKEAEAYWIADLKSRNGVFVNGQQVSDRKRLMDGNLIKLGFTIFRFESV